jgi:hypothetical protein
MGRFVIGREEAYLARSFGDVDERYKAARPPLVFKQLPLTVSMGWHIAS